MSGSLAQLERHHSAWDWPNDSPIYLCEKNLFIAPSLAYFCAVILLQWYLLYREHRSRVLLHWFFCFVMTLNSASVLSAKWTSHTCTRTDACTLTHCDRLLWAHNLIQDNLLLWDYWFVSYAMKQVSFWSILAAINFKMLPHSLHSNDMINMSSKMLSTQKYRVIIQRREQDKYDKNTTVRWHCFICEVPETETAEAPSFPEYHPSSKPN